MYLVRLISIIEIVVKKLGAQIGSIHCEPTTQVRPNRERVGHFFPSI
ncbi:hypothetical protein GCM10025794_28260 [Massilia kyonggiensis]